MINLNKHSILATDFSKVDKELEHWILEREKQADIYKAYSEYILCLKNSIKNESDPLKRHETEKLIKKLEKEKQNYYIPSILGDICLFKETELTRKKSNKFIKILKNKFKK